MGEITEISWTDHTFNPWIGCTKVSPACDGCYAEHMMAHRYGKVRWGAGEDRKRTAPANWRKPIAWNRAAAAKAGRTFVFCASLADVFDNEVDPKWRADLFALIEATPALTWLLLTKRIGNVLKMTDPMAGCSLIPPNAAIGATMANQEEYDRDCMKLWEVKRIKEPAFTFGSLEPLLGPIILDKHAPDWIITGGETDQGAHKARPSHPDWFRGLRDQCRELGRPFHLKQWGEWAPGDAFGLIQDGPVTTRDGTVRDWMKRYVVCADRADRLDGHSFTGHATNLVYRVGKKRAGAKLDGVEHREFPR